jgi:hypothetical protein
MLTFIHPDNIYSVPKEQLVTSVYNALINYISLPDTIMVEFRCLGPASYGEAIVDSRHAMRRVILNVDLTPKELFIPTIHELVHVHQMHVGKLSTSRTGVYVWEGKTYPIDTRKISYTEYQNLPWELDATAQQKILAKKLLENQSPT